MLHRLGVLLVWLFVVGQVFGIGLYYHQVLQAVGAVLAMILGFVAIALPFVSLMWIKDHKNPVLRSLGTLLEVVTAHSALLYGTILTVIVFLGIGLVNGDPMPSNLSEFLVEFVGVCFVTSAMIYGAMAVCIIAFSERLSSRLLGGTLALVVIGVPLVWSTTQDLKSTAQTSSSLFLFACCTYLALGSVICWRVFLTSIKKS